jgi:biopolymer transport protein TolQ
MGWFDMPWLMAGVGFAWRESNLAGKVIVVLLFWGSILAWSVMLTKHRELRRARIMSGRFLKAFRREGHPASLFLKRTAFTGSPLFEIYQGTLSSLAATLEGGGAESEELFMGAVASDTRWLDDTQVGVIRQVAERTAADESFLLERHMGLLATAVSAAPFLGLLGTVWGVMDAFAGMAQTGSAMLSAVAPGISGALVTTVIGLLVALPSAIGYNLLSDQLRRLQVEMDHFAQELISSIERHYRLRGEDRR